ncbi:NIPSNAP family protein [Pseudodonghicola flavimaris]|uniref:NIPSNAP family protein n=1 Tax=Pseudodonghicola flavimaris TaxID=3050036 RepID=A0ABT7EWX6_9RHOB|nr:NIPSNAP family protein [Pseudodonghicola flavimaris]MDK3016843.1 NIPSNAP family protein [Pseudodonghicola flavimaris]
MINEIREYTPMPGRLGDVIDLFGTVLIPLFRRHGMEVVQAGVTTIGDSCFNELVYTMRFSDLAEMERKWAAFLTDPEWPAALAEREKSGPLYQAIRRRVVDTGAFDSLLDGATA